MLIDSLEKKRYKKVGKMSDIEIQLQKKKRAKFMKKTNGILSLNFVIDTVMSLSKTSENSQSILFGRWIGYAAVIGIVKDLFEEIDTLKEEIHQLRAKGARDD